MNSISLRVLTIIVSIAGCAGAAWAGPCLVEDGVPRAEIVIAETPPRMAALAALELQHYVEKISGARLPIVTQPGTNLPLQVYVGRSPYTDRLGVTDEGLAHGAYRMAANSEGIVLLGHDADFTPQEPWSRKHTDGPRALAEWDALTERVAGRKWGFLFGSTFKGWWNPREYDVIMAKNYGDDNEAIWNPSDVEWSPKDPVAGMGRGFWLNDDAGSLNAVYAFLRSLGVRWYLPGELGEVIPERATIAVPSLDVTAHPDFAIRSYSWYGYGGFSFDNIMWARRIGINSGHEILGSSFAHGHVKVFGRDDMKAAHPEYYALIGGQRDTAHRGYGTACYSSPGLVEETVKYARFLYDQFDQPHVSIWPGDGFKKCGCEACRDQGASELVWGFVDRVARELYKTHPDRLISCGAYTPYIYPPKNVEKFTPNVAVFIANCGRARFGEEAWWNDYWQRVEGWRRKLAPGRIIRNENNRYSLHGNPGGTDPIPFPAIHPRAMAKDIHALKGISIGERCEESQSKAHWVAPGCDHLNLYVQARFLWDADQDVDALLDEYYAQFYGPAGDKMKAAFDFAEANLTVGRSGDWEVRVKFLEMLQAARRAAGDTVYGRRVQLILDELVPLDQAREEMKKQATAGDPRENNPVLLALGTNGKQELKSYRMKNLVTGKQPDVQTSFTVGWDGEALVFDIRCEEPDMPSLFVSDNVWDGDSVGIVLETPSHAYYQIEVNPDGKVFDADRAGKADARWESMAEVQTERGADYWRAEVRLPIAIEGEGGEMDPNHYVVGPRPDAKIPWYVNVGRIRVRDWQKASYGFVPTGGSYHVPAKFARLVIR